MPAIGYSQDVINYVAETPRIKTYDGSVDLPENYNSKDAFKYMEEEIAKFVYGKRPIGEHADFQETPRTAFKPFKHQSYLDV